MNIAPSKNSTVVLKLCDHHMNDIYCGESLYNIIVVYVSKVNNEYINIHIYRKSYNNSKTVNVFYLDLYSKVILTFYHKHATIILKWSNTNVYLDHTLMYLVINKMTVL